MRAKTTRGKTKPGRLDALDRAILRIDPPKGGEPALGWDLGFGAHPQTTLDWGQALRDAGWDARILGLEVHEGRAAFATRFNSAKHHFAQLDTRRTPPWDQPPRWIRAMNILRQYRAEHCATWHQRWATQLAPHGHLFEGTCSADGSVLVAHWIRPLEDATYLRQGLLFYTDFQQGFAPLLFGDRLPKDLRAHARQAGPVGDFFRRWTLAWETQRHLSPKQAFTQSVTQMDPQGSELIAWEDGVGASLLWTPPGGVPIPTDA